MNSPEHPETYLREIKDLKTALDEHAIVAITDLQGRITYANDRFCQISKYSRAELLGQDHRLLNSGLHAREFMRELWKTITHGRVWRGELRNRAKDGSLYWVYTTIVPVLDAHGQPRQYIAIRTEITERKLAEEALRESEARFRQMAENVEEIVWMTDPANREVFYISPAFEKTFGRPCAEFQANPGCWTGAILPGDRERIQEARAKQASGQFREEYRIQRPDGTIRWIRDRAYPVRNESGEVYRLVGVSQDVTDQKKLEEQFFRTQRLEAIGMLAGGMAHDLNNILAPSLMVAGLLKVRFPGDKNEHLLNMIENSAQRGAALIRQLLLFSRGVEGAHMAVQVRHLLKEMAVIMRETFPREITIIDEDNRDLWPVSGDATQLHQVLMNLCVNARDAMPLGGKLILSARNLEIPPEDLHLHPGAQTGKYLIMSVRDTGMGIPPEIMQHIFDPFFTTKDVGKGTGLGLSTVRGIVKNHRGFVTAYSEVGQGTVFNVYLPVDAKGLGETRPPLTAPSSRGRNELIMIVDDEAPIANATRLVLESENYRVLVATQGKEAAAQFLAHQDDIALVVTDLMMPVMGGVELVRGLRLIRPDLPVIATTGLDSDERRAELAELGITEILPKPSSSADLLNAIRRQLDHPAPPPNRV